jgi:acetyl-CoA carboxylase biotin carboxyl carrier protein
MRSKASNPHVPPSPRHASAGVAAGRAQGCSIHPGEHAIATPQSGVFYRHPGPGKPPYVAEGGTVGVGQAVGLVEGTKQFTEVTSTAAGTLDRFVVVDCSEVSEGTVVAVVRSDR